MNETRVICRGDIYYADLSPTIGSEQGGIRPVLIIQNNVGNKYGPTVIAAAITTKLKKSGMPTHVPMRNIPGVMRNSYILLEQIRTLDKSRLQEYVCSLERATMKNVDAALAISIGDYHHRS